MSGTCEVASVVYSTYSGFRCDVIRIEDGYRNQMATKIDEEINHTDFRAKSKKTSESITYALNCILWKINQF
jgi:hypothetical protein